MRHRKSEYRNKFDQEAIESNAVSFPQMKRWSKAGTRKPIPDLRHVKADVVLNGGSSEDINENINKLKLDLEDNGGNYRVLLLKNGIYDINDRVRMESNIIIKGQSRNGVLCVVNMTSRSAFYVGDIENSGLYRMTIRGVWGRPKYKWNFGTNKKNQELPGNDNISVYFSKLSRDCWIENVRILDSADFPLRCAGEHITMRNVVVNRVHNKHGGSHGYWIILGRDNLITKSKATQLRHISMQGNRAEYNVFFDNDFRQEISFHVGDLGNNLIAHNRITLPKGMPNGRNGRPDYRAIMGPWSKVHEKSKMQNFLHKNTLLERNHGDARRMADDKVYVGPIFNTSKGEQQTRNFPPSELKPIGGTLYPIRP
ncbi:Pectin lyase fold/virulence factor [Gracilaria domingensis]|nr:Pectin lyase fold/virulence factor [Gracilaria domingensis]